jgi:dihydrodipicolinate synthase/N-acetylneuraminate lyase
LGVLALAGHGALAAGAIAKSPNGKALAGVFPIGWTPCKADNSFDADAMMKQQQFLNRGKVAGMAWPQNASGWQSLSAQEWNAGAEALASVKGDTALVLGVQTTGFDIANSQAYAKKAKSLNADAIISLVPPNASDADAIAYFKALADAGGLPMMVQAVGNVSVDSLVALAAAVPTIVAVKDEAGDPLERAPDLLQKSSGKLEDFSGGGGMTFFAELELGFLGTCPYTGLADVLQACFNAYRAGRKRDAYDTFGRFLAFNSLPHANEYVMKARGVFAEDAIMRANPGAPAGGGNRRRGAITEADKAEIRLALNSYLKPFLVA